MKKTVKIVLIVCLLLIPCILISCNNSTPSNTDPQNIEHTHNFGEWKTINDANCTDNGIEKRTCACGKSEEQTIDAYGHTEVIDSAIDATCTTDGLTEGVHCSVCNTVLTEQQKVKSNGHSYISTVVEATKTEKGYTLHTCSACGDSYTDNYVEATGSLGLAYRVNDDGITCTIIGIGNCSDNDIIIPDKIDGYEVIAIEALISNTIESINIPDNVTNIGEAAFMNCSSLKEINIPNTLTVINNSVFSGCSSLTNIILSDNITEIGYGAFMGCSSLKDINIPKNVVSIGAYAFMKCHSLTHIVIPENVSNLAKGAFSDCHSLTDITIPDSSYINAFDISDQKRLTSITITGGTYIHDAAFIYCTSLTNIIIPEGVTTIGNDAFFALASLTSVSFPNSLVEIGDYAFAACYSLTNIIIPENLSTLGRNAFVNDADYPSVFNIKNITFPSIDSIKKLFRSLSAIDTLESVTILSGSSLDESYIFVNCTTLKSVSLPNTITHIGGLVFVKCSSLTDINYGGTIAEWEAISKHEKWNFTLGDYTIHCTDGDITK